MLSYINRVHSCTVRHKCVLIFAQKFVQYLKMTFLNQSSDFLGRTVDSLYLLYNSSVLHWKLHNACYIYNIAKQSLLFLLFFVCVRVCVKSVTLISDASPGAFLYVGMSCYHFCIQLHWLIVDFVGFSKTRGQD